MALKNHLFLILKSIIVTFFLTILMLFLFAALIWKFDFPDIIMNGMNFAVYIVSCLVGGFYLGKKKKEKKYLWGLVLGICIYGVFLLLSIAIDGYSGAFGNDLFVVLLVCALSSALGGMIA